MLQFDRIFDFFTKMWYFGILCGIWYESLGLGGSKASFKVIECKNNYCRGLTKGFYHCYTLCFGYPKTPCQLTRWTPHSSSDPRKIPGSAVSKLNRNAAALLSKKNITNFFGRQFMSSRQKTGTNTKDRKEEPCRGRWIKLQSPNCNLLQNNCWVHGTIKQIITQPLNSINGDFT
jgi:hypothetical protein